MSWLRHVGRDWLARSYPVSVCATSALPSSLAPCSCAPVCLAKRMAKCHSVMCLTGLLPRSPRHAGTWLQPARSRFHTNAEALPYRVSLRTCMPRVKLRTRSAALCSRQRSILRADLLLRAPIWLCKWSTCRPLQRVAEDHTSLGKHSKVEQHLHIGNRAKRHTSPGQRGLADCPEQATARPRL